MAVLKVVVPNFSKSAIEELLLYELIRDTLLMGQIMVIEPLNSDPCAHVPPLPFMLSSTGSGRLENNLLFSKKKAFCACLKKSGLVMSSANDSAEFPLNHYIINVMV